MLQRGAFQAHPHAVSGARNGVLGAEERLDTTVRDVIILRSEDDANPPGGSQIEPWQHLLFARLGALAL